MILVALKDGHAPTQRYVDQLRQALPAAFPESIFYFQAADMMTQILNFGVPAQINVRTVGYDRVNNLRVARELRQRIAAIPGLACLRPAHCCCSAAPSRSAFGNTTACTRR